MGEMGKMMKVAVHGKEGFKNAEKGIWRSWWRYIVARAEARDLILTHPDP